MTSPRKKQVIICGFARSGSTLLYNMLRHACPDIVAPEQESSALSLLYQDVDSCLSKRPLDVFRIDELRKANAERKDLRLVITVRDPRALVCSIHRRVPMQWFQGFDHSFFVLPDGLSFCHPGLMATHRAASRACRSGLPILVCHYEELVLAPERVQRRLAEFTGFDMKYAFADFHSSEIPPPLQPQLNGVRSLDQSRLRPWLEDARLAERIVRQFQLEPKLFDVMTAWGYEQSRDWFDELAARVSQAHVNRQGTIVSFFTEGTRYEKEAARLAHTARRLGLPIDIAAVPDRGNWLKNVRFKARFLREKRKQLRGPLLWIDADAVLRADPWPYLAEYDGDMAVATHNDGHLISATLWLNDTVACRTALDRWHKGMAADPAINDQLALERIVNESRSEWPHAAYRFQYLPPSLCYVFDRTKRQFPEVVPIIEQLQASREIRLDGKNNQENLARRHARIAELERELELADTNSAASQPS